MRFLVFFVVWSIVLGSAFYYILKRALHPLVRTRTARRRIWFFVVLAWAIPAVSFFVTLYRKESRLLDTLAWVGYIILGVLSLVLTFLLLRDATLGVAAVFRIVRKQLTRHLRSSSGAPPDVDPERRIFLLRSTNLAILTAAAGSSMLGFYEARHRAQIRSIAIPFANLPPEFDGLRIAQFSDFHIGPTIKRPYVQRVVEQIRSIGADCIVFTGDLVDGTVAWLRDDVAPLRELAAPMGKFFVTGNHEYYSGATEWVDEARQLGFTVLLNQHELIERDGSRIALAGVTDYTGGQFLPAHESKPLETGRAIQEGLFKILLAHQPVSAHAAAAAGFDLQLSGHTHGGQFFPWNYVAYLNQPFIKGLHRMGRMWVYVNSGVGYWGPPLRLGALPEITHITLVRDVGGSVGGQISMR